MPGTPQRDAGRRITNVFAGGHHSDTKHAGGKKRNAAVIFVLPSSQSSAHIDLRSRDLEAQHCLSDAVLIFGSSEFDFRLRLLKLRLA